MWSADVSAQPFFRYAARTLTQKNHEFTCQSIRQIAEIADASACVKQGGQCNSVHIPFSNMRPGTQRRGFEVQGFRGVKGHDLRGWNVQRACGFKVQGFRVQGFRVQGFRGIKGSWVQGVQRVQWPRVQGDQGIKCLHGSGREGSRCTGFWGQGLRGSRGFRNSQSSRLEGSEQLPLYYTSTSLIPDPQPWTTYRPSDLPTLSQVLQHSPAVSSAP